MNRDLPVDQVVSHFGDLFGISNEMFLGGDRREILAYVAAAVRRLADGLRKGDGSLEVFTTDLVSAFTWTVAVAGSFGPSYLGAALAYKYGRGYCGHCFQVPCHCQEKGRQQPSEKFLVLSWLNHHTVKLSVDGWQVLLRRIFPNTNLVLKDYLLRVFEEIVEFMTIRPWLRENRGKTSLEMLEDHFLELADIFAWLCGIASYMAVDLQTAVWTVYPEYCRPCNDLCRCGEFRILRGATRDHYPRSTSND